ncbi:MAG TPA: acyltransferase family protein [Pseudodesulfovibrio sp.]|nr:acyltransferase family protein [Pseudodesulfovibrio sp.]
MYRSGHPGNGDRDLSIDIAKAFGITLVVIGHSYSPFPLEKIIYSFHMPLFFIVSGLLYKSRGIVRTMRNKWYGLAAPYLLALLVTLPVLWVIGRGDAFNAHLIIDTLGAKNEELIWNSPMWFLPSLFSTFLFFVLIEAVTRNIRIAAVAGMVLGLLGSYLVPSIRGLLFFGLDTAVPALFFFSLGVLASNSEGPRAASPKWNLTAFALCFAAWAAARFLGGHPYFVMAKFRIAPYMFFFATGVAGSFAVVYFARFLEQTWKRGASSMAMRGLMFLSSSMFGIYIFHKPVILIVRRFLPPLNGFQFIVLALAGMVVSSAILALLRAVSPRLTKALTGSR